MFITRVKASEESPPYNKQMAKKRDIIINQQERCSRLVPEETHLGQKRLKASFRQVRLPCLNPKSFR